MSVFSYHRKSQRWRCDRRRRPSPLWKHTGQTSSLIFITLFFYIQTSAAQLPSCSTAAFTTCRNTDAGNFLHLLYLRKRSSGRLLTHYLKLFCWYKNVVNLMFSASHHYKLTCSTSETPNCSQHWKHNTSHISSTLKDLNQMFLHKTASQTMMTVTEWRNKESSSAAENKYTGNVKHLEKLLIL